MEHAHARRPRAEEEIGRDVPRALRVVPSPAREAPEQRGRTERGRPVRATERGGRPVARAAPLPFDVREDAPRPPRRSTTPREERASGSSRRGAAARADGRRTVQIGGQATVPRTRPRARRSPSAGGSPDRLALWAVVLSLFLALVAAATARGEVERPASGPAPAVETVR